MVRDKEDGRRAYTYIYIYIIDIQEIMFWGGGGCAWVYTNEKNNDRQDGKTEVERDRLAQRFKMEI